MIKFYPLEKISLVCISKLKNIRTLPTFCGIEHIGERIFNSLTTVVLKVPKVEIMASLQGFDHIGEKIFKFHNGKEVLNFRLVCKSWKKILDNPMYWLKKLNQIGQPKTAYNNSLVLLRKASRVRISPTKIGYCLLIKYMLLSIATCELLDSCFEIVFTMSSTLSCAS